VPRLGAGSAPAKSVEQHLNGTPSLRDQDWTRWRIKDTQKGPMVWEVKHVLLTPKDENGLCVIRLAAVLCIVLPCGR
jgi:hypothetical protein